MNEGCVNSIYYVDNVKVLLQNRMIAWINTAIASHRYCEQHTKIYHITDRTLPKIT